MSFAGEKFRKVVWVEHGASGSGDSESNPLPMVDGDLWAIPAGTVIENVYTVIKTAVTGVTDFDVGDDDDADGFIDGSVSLTLGTPGMYSYDAKVAGAYLRVETAGATDAGDIYVVPNAKYYAAAGKEVKLDVTGTSTAGKFAVVIEGFYLGY
jgi:hypothetical protein